MKERYENKGTAGETLIYTAITLSLSIGLHECLSNPSKEEYKGRDLRPKTL